MGASLGGGGSRRRGQRAQPFAEINITPMVDVMLVLLVIFMVAAPMMTTGVTVDLPESSASPVAGQDEPLSVTIAADGKIYIQKTVVTLKQLNTQLSAIAKEKKDTRIFVRGDKTVDYGRIMQVVGEINAAGLTKVALITETASDKEVAVKETRKKGVWYSASLHAVLLLLVIFGLPGILSFTTPDEPQAIVVELLPITGVTNVKPQEPKPAEKSDPKEEAKPKEKPQPPVKTKESAPPPPEPKIAEKKVEKPKEKPPEPKKEEKKKSTEEDLEAVLKAVRETAAKEKAEAAKKETANADSETKSKSNNYDPTMPLSLSEKDAIRSQIQKCWSVPAGAKNAHELVVVLSIQLEKDGSLVNVTLANESKARYNADTFFRAAAESAIRAVKQCSPLKNLPEDKFSSWRDMELTFDPKEMLF